MYLIQWLTLFFITFFSAPLYSMDVVEKESGFIFSKQNISSDELYYSSTLVKDSEWLGQRQDQIFRPSRNYVSLENYNPVENSENLEIFKSEVAFIANSKKTAAFFNRQKAVDILNLMDEGFSHKVLSAKDANKIYQKAIKGAYNSSNQVLTDKLNRFSDPISESQFNNAQVNLDQLYQTLREKRWCSESNTSCIRSLVTFDSELMDIIENVSSLLMSSSMEIPTNIEVYSELVQQSNSEFQLSSPEIDSIPYSAGNVLIQNGFLSNVLIQYTKVVISVHQYSEGQSLVVIQSVVGLEKDDLDSVQSSLIDARTVLMGQSVWNADEGFSMGLPLLQITMAQKLKKALQ